MDVIFNLYYMIIIITMLQFNFGYVKFYFVDL